MSDNPDNKSRIVNPENYAIIMHLVSVANHYKSSGDKRKSGTFYRIANTLSQVSDRIDKEYDVTQHHGVGGSAKREVDQFLETGTSERLESLKYDSRNDIPSDETLAQSVGRVLSLKSGMDRHTIESLFIMTVAVNGLSDAVSCLDKLQSFDKKLLDAGLEEVLLSLR